MAGLLFDPRYAASPGGVKYPFMQVLRGEAFAQDSPLVGRQSSWLAQWPSPWIVQEERPAGLTLTELIHSSEMGYLVPAPDRLELDAESIQLLYAKLQVKANPAQHLLAFEMRGEFPTAFPEGPPAVRDPLGDGEIELADERPLELAPGRLLALGDSDWLDVSRTGGALPPAHQGLLANLIDWLGAEEELVALRTKVPRARPLRDLLAEQLEREGLLTGQTLTAERSAALQRAEENARAEQRRLMLWTSAGSLLAVALLGVVRLLRRRSAPRVRAGEVPA